MRRLALLGWNDNTLRCLNALVFHQRMPAVVVVPSHYEATALREQAYAWGIDIREAGRTTGLRDLLPDVELVASASWPLRIDADDIAAFAGAIINVHGAALPRWRGAHPLNWALAADDPEIGVTVHHVTVGLDEGDIIAQATFPIADEDTLLDIRDLVHRRGARLLVEAIQLLDEGVAPRVPQQHALATHATRRRPEDGRIDWNATARQCFAHIRASGRPTPGAFTHREETRVTIWRAAVSHAVSRTDAPAGTVLQAGAIPLVQTGGGGVLSVLEWDGPALRPGDLLR